MQRFMIRSASSPEVVGSGRGSMIHYRLAIVGSRTFTDQALFERVMTAYVERYGVPTRVVSGGADGADTLARQWANARSLPLDEFLPQWDAPQYAGPRRPQAALDRNTTIVEHCERLIAFQRAGSTGTQDSIRKARKRLGESCVQVETLP
jgi:hypothetical protein